MKGLALTATVSSQVVVASRKAPDRSKAQAGVAGSRLHSSSATPASASSLSMPAAPMARRWRRERSFQASLVSVYSTGHMTRKARPMVGTRQPKRVAVKAWPSSCRTLATLSAAPTARRPSQLP